MKQFIVEKVKYLINHLTGKKAVVVMLTMLFLWLNHPKGEPFTITEIVTSAGLATALIGAWAYEKVNKKPTE